MEFRELLQQAKQGNSDAVTVLFLQYRPLLLSLSKTTMGFDEDLFQELSKTFLQCVHSFHINWE